MYADNYARYRDGPPPVPMGGGGPPPSAMMQQVPSSRPRLPGDAPAMRGAYDAAAMAMPMDMAPEDLAKSLQPVAGRYMGRRPSSGNAPSGPLSGRGGGGEDQWSPSAEYTMTGGYGGAYVPQAPSPHTMSAPRPMARPPPPSDGYGPPAKYRRTSDFDEFEDPRNSGGGGGGGQGTRGNRSGSGGPRGPSPPLNYRGSVNSYDMPTRDGGRGSAPPAGPAAYALPSQPQFRPPPQRAGYAPYAPPSPHTPRTPQEMMMRRRLMQQERDSFGEQPGGGYRGGPPTPNNGGGGPPPGMSSTAVAWARELETYDNARRIHRELQPPIGGVGGGNESPLTPRNSAQLWMQRGAASRYDNSPGSRIVTPAATLHSSQRAGEWVAARRNPMKPNARMMEPPGQPFPPSLQQQQPEPTPYAYNEIEPVPLGMGNAIPPNGPMPRGRMPRGPVNAGARSLPPAAMAQLSMQEYDAMMMMERELGAPPMQDPRRTSGPPGNPSRPMSAESNGRSRGRAMPPGPPVGEDKFDAQAFMMQQQKDDYPIPPAAPVPTAPLAPPKRSRQPKTSTGAPPMPPAAASKKRKEPAASKRKARNAAEDITLMDEAEAPPKARSKAASAKNNADSNTGGAEPKRRCGRKSMNYSSEQKRERNRAAVKKCRQRQALKYDYLKRKAEVLASENRALSEMLVKNVELDDEKRNSLTRGIQMDILLKIKEIFTQSLPKDFVLDADSIWDLNSVLAVSMPSRCYYGIESIKDFWRTSLRMRNKGKIRSFWAWLFRLPPGDRFAEFTITPFSPTSNLYFINWTTKSTPALSGSIVIMFGHGHRVTLHVEIFGWLIWRYLLTNTPFPEPPLE